MPVIIIDGPEKAGKTTLINELVRSLVDKGIPAERVHWGPVSPDDRVYSVVLQPQCQDLGKVWVWDRGWPSEHVYGKLLGRDHRGATDPWLLEWLHGRAVQVNGVRVILTGPHSSILERLRTDDDLSVVPSIERQAYIKYGEAFGWDMIHNNTHTQESLNASIKYIECKLFSQESFAYKQWSPPKFAGPPDAKVVIVGEKLSDKPIAGGWLPFTSYFTTLLGRDFGDYAFKVLWTNAADCDPQLLRNKETIIACGRIAADWCRREIKGGSGQKIINIPHPSYLYRFHNEKSRQQLEYVRQAIQSLKPL